MVASFQRWLDAILARVFRAGSLRERFARGVVWALAGTMISQGLTLAATVFVARWLGKAGYGELGIVKSTVGMFGVFVGLGLGLTSTKYVSELRQEDPRRAGRIIALTMTIAVASGLVVTVALVLLAPWLATRTLASREVAVPLALGAAMLLFGEIKGVQNGVLAGLEAFGTMARVNLWAGLAAFPIILAAAWLWRVSGAVVGLAVALAVNCLMNHVALGREAAGAGIPLEFSGCWSERGVLWKFSLPAFLGSALTVPTIWVCNAELVNQPRGYAEMGLFSAADQWRTIVLFLPNILSRVLLPILSNYSNESAREAGHFSNTLDAGFAASLAIVLPLITAFSFGGPLIVGAYGKDFAGMARPLAGLLCGAGLVAIGTPGGLALQAKGAMWLGFLINLTWAVLLVGSFHLLVGRGAWGLALAYTFSYLSLAVTSLWYVCKAGYYPWRLGARTYLASFVLLAFAFTPVFLSARVSLRLSPLALAASLAVTWMLMPKTVRQALARKTNAGAWLE